MELATLTTIQQNFLSELHEANKGTKTSLPFIIHDFAATPLVEKGERFQVIVIGGSVFLNALMERKNGTYRMIKRESKGQKKFQTKEDFLSLMEEEVDPTVKVLAMNVAYPLQPVFENGRLDGILVSGSKENEFEGLLGQKMGYEIEQRIFEKTGRKITVSVANDTVGLLLSGLTEVTTHDIAGGVLGTGVNFAFFLDENRLVNLEAANFDKFPQTDDGRIVDQESVKPGTSLFEKETSGAYLYKHYNAIIERDHLPYPKLTATIELDRLLDNTSSGSYAIAKMLLERSAGYIAAAIAGITAFKGKDMTFVMEGSLFWNARGYRAFVKSRLLELIPEYNVTFVKIEDSPIFGAAKLVS
jgi:hexokinase